MQLYFSTNIYQGMETYILLENVEMYANHGVFSQETLVGNLFIINLKLKVDFEKASKSDDLDETISYASVFDLVKKEMAIPSKLLEHVAGRIVRVLKKEFPKIEQIELKISKRNPPVGGQVEYASVMIID